ncbi:MAG TPA: MauE/DoxX family redox-associated membrane protein [Euzebyales bacterium]|nr:MauE/DoxX family redox-associated membrane protein [Euzebyales bacterium]
MADGGLAVYGVVAAAVVFPTLLAAGCWHVFHTGTFARVLALHGWPARLSRPGSVLLAVTEVGLGATGVVGVAFAGVHPAVAVAAALLCAAYAVDAARILRSGAPGGRGPDVPCGCGAVDHPVNVWVAVRATAYACLAVVAAVAGQTVGALAPAAAAMAAGAAMVIGLLLWLLPRTLAIPPGYTLQP